MTTDIVPLTTERAAEPEAGLGALATSRGNLPLAAVDIRAAIAGTSASVELIQSFRNPFDVPLEAMYVFPLPDRAAVTAMRMECAGHVVEAALKERSRAREDYDQAIAEGRRAAIAEEDRADVFTMRAGRKVVAKPLARPVRAGYQGLSARRVGDADRLVQARRQLADEVLRAAYGTSRAGC